ncbi:MAG TPA: hypothetical protein VJL29_06305 [Thermoguttaceae bacterium]|nr:hypothetical protein [Thermoguttaceae bacterium]
MGSSEYYHRERGPVCYALPLFASSERPYRRVTDAVRQALLTPDLGWSWRSSVRGENDTSNEIVSQNRPLTRLSAQTFADFVADVQYIDEWDNGKGIDLFGYDPDAASAIISEYDSGFRTAIDRFAVCEGGPLRLVIITLEDQENSLVFVPHDPVPIVEKLLETWNASWAKANARRKYHRLRGVKLETIFSLPFTQS